MHRKIFSALTLILLVIAIALPATVSAEIINDGTGGSVTSTDSTPSTTIDNDCSADNLTKDNCGIINYLVIFINILSGIVGVVVVVMIIMGGIQYSSSGDNPQAISAARKRISNALLALLVFFFMYAFLQWLVPGGIF